MALTKADMVSSLFQQVGLNKRESKAIVSDFFEIIKDNIADCENVKLSGFGKFHVLHKSARPGRNPKSGEEVEIEPRSVVSFKCSNLVKARLTDKDKK